MHSASTQNLEVIGAGLPMTGCETLTKALAILGFGSSSSIPSRPRSRTDRRPLLPLLKPSIPDLREYRHNSRCTVEECNSLQIPQLVTAFPQAKVILTVGASPEIWWQNYDPAVNRSSIAEEIVPALGLPNGPAWYEKHRRWTRGFVQKDRLLEYNVQDGWEPLCRFLRVPVPDVPFPSSDERARKA